MLNNNKKFILTSAIAGSGKSTLAAKIKQEHLDKGCSVFCIETDEWFIKNGNGTYKFERAKLNDAHSWTFREVTKAFQDEIDVVILANTNLYWKEIKRYILCAREYGYMSEVVAPDTPWCNNPEECFKRNIHGVPLEQLMKMEAKRQSIDYLRAKIQESYEEKYIF